MPKTDSLTPERIAQLVELYERTTQGEWKINKYLGIGCGEFGTDPVVVDFHQGFSVVDTDDDADREWIAAAHNTMPALLEALAGKDAELKAAHARICQRCECPHIRLEPRS